MSKIPDCLAYAGILGHTWFVTVDDGAGGERLLLQANTGESAVKHYDEAGDRARGIYTRVGRKFKRVTRAAAVID